MRLTSSRIRLSVGHAPFALPPDESVLAVRFKFGRLGRARALGERRQRAGGRSRLRRDRSSTPRPRSPVARHLDQQILRNLGRSRGPSRSAATMGVRRPPARGRGERPLNTVCPQRDQDRSGSGKVATTVGVRQRPPKRNPRSDNPADPRAPKQEPRSSLPVMGTDPDQLPGSEAPRPPPA